MRNFLIILFCLLILPLDLSAWPFPGVLNYNPTSIQERQGSWPNWDLPGPFRKSRLIDEFIFPDSFKGEWKIYSIDLIDEHNQSYQHFAKFKLDADRRVLADNLFNAKSLGKEVFGEDLIDIIDKPNSSNVQLAFFKGGNFLETKVIGRIYEISSNDVFFTDEIDMQIFHTKPNTRVNKVETLSRYSSCDDLKISFQNISLNSMCAEQFQVRYNISDNIFRPSVDNKNHFLLIFIPPENEFSLDDFLIDLSSQKDEPTMDDR
tara:strand:- start:272 stop:1057 length:786 start_codon:yes stop_codon:yes gene_type:complete